MIRSMTGFGEAAMQVDGIHYAVELRSLNNRYFKATIRLPEEIGGLEAELESHLRKRVHRGSLVLTVKMRISGDAAISSVNDHALRSYLDHLQTLQQRVPDQAVHIDLTALLMLPGVLEPSEDDTSLLNKSRPVVLQLLDQATQRLDAMRQTEGQTLAADVLAQCEVIRQQLDLIRQRAPQVTEEWHQRLRQRMDDMMARAELKVHEADLIKEVAVYADRCDISEESTRTACHLDHVQQVIHKGDGEPSGRTLDFLAQELLREANTMASKSNDAAISRAVVIVKSAIDRIKEQVQNME